MPQNWTGDPAALQTVLGAARMPIVLADARQADHPIVFANQAFLDLTGYAREEVLGRNCRFLQGPGTDRGAVGRIRDALAQAQPVTVEVLNYRADGSTFWNALFMGPVFDGAGKPRYFLGNQLDVSRQKVGEEALRHVQTVEAVGHVATGLADSLGDRLQIVIGALELMAPKLKDAGISRYGARALHGARDAADLVHQLLAFARKAPLTPRPTHVAETLRRMRPRLDAMAEGRALRLALAPSSRRVLLDRTQFEAAMLSLVANARDATTSQGGIVIALEDADLDGAPAVSISVGDDGEGMSREVLQRAVEPFFTTRPRSRHAGLGLSMVSGFVAQSLGRFDLQAKGGAGARAIMVFPATLLEIVQTGPSPEAPASTPGAAG